MKYNSYKRGAGEIGGIGALLFVGLVVVFVLWIFGFNFGITNQGTVSYSDCRQVITLQSGSWETYFHSFTCMEEKTKSGAVMDGVCVATKNDGSLLGNSSTCATAFVYQLSLPTTCQSNTKNGVSYPYLGYDDQCYTTPQSGETAISSPPNSTATAATVTNTATQTITPIQTATTPSAGTLPAAVGQCDSTTISQIGTRLTDGSGNPVTGSGSAIWYADNGYQVSYDTVQGITDSKVGDQVNLCLVSVPSDCPAGDNRGYVYKATNLRTGENWEAQNSEHSCGGA